MKRIFALLLALAMTLSLTTFAGEFNAGVSIKTDKNGNTTITVQDSDLYEKQDVTLTVDCALSEAYVVYNGKAVESSLKNGKITFSVIGGGTYTIKKGTPSADELPEPATVIVTYTDGVDGVEIFKDQTYTVDQGAATPAFSGTPSRTGYTFKGWSPEVAETATTDMTYIAQWEINKYKLTWSNGDGGSYEQELVYGATITVPNNEFFNDTMRKAGHTLTGWTNAENYEVGASMPAQALTFTAQYTVHTYTVTYTDGVDGAEIFKDQTSTVAYGSATPAFSGTPFRLGYTFKGWSPAVAETVTANATYVAQWTANPSRPSKPSSPSDKEEPHQPEVPSIQPPFTDIKENDWFYADVAWVYEKGLMNGTGADSFSPNATTSRGMIVTILWRLEGMPTAGACTFQDVKSGSYYEQAIAWAAENGIVNGYCADSFRPDGTITREQFATILYRYAKEYKGFDVSVGEDTNILSFADAFSISDYAFSSLQWACGAGLMNGSGDSLMPGGSATRAQAAALLHRFCENVK